MIIIGIVLLCFINCFTLDWSYSALVSIEWRQGMVFGLAGRFFLFDL